MSYNKIKPEKIVKRQIWKQDDTYNNNLKLDYRSKLNAIGFKDEQIERIFSIGLPEMSMDFFADAISNNGYSNILL